MAEEISLSVFEKNAKRVNKKGMLRSYTTLVSHLNEYIPGLPIGITDKLVLECVIDKEYVSEFINILKEKEFNILGSENTFHIEKLLGDYEMVKSNVKDQAPFEKMEKDYEELKANLKEYKEIENDDVKFYFLPYSKDVKTLSDFVEETKEVFTEFSKKNDLTLMFRIKACSTDIDGFICYNFVNAESEEHEEIDFFSNINISVNYKVPVSVCLSAMLLNAVSTNEADLELMNTHITAENVYYRN